MNVSARMWAVGALICVAAVVGTGAAFESRSHDPAHALIPPGGANTWKTGGAKCSLGENVYMAVIGMKVKGDSPVHLTGASVVGVPAGLRVAGINGMSFADNPQGPIGIATADYFAKLYARQFSRGPVLKPVGDVVLPPHTNRGSWWLVVTLQQTEPGVWTTGGLRVHYTAGGSTGTATFPYRAQLRCR